MDNTNEQSNRVEEFEQLLGLYERRIYAYIKTLIPNAIDAENVLQETCIVLWRKFTDYKRGTNFVAWAMSVARFMAFKERDRQIKNPVKYSDALLCNVSERTESIVEEYENRKKILGDCIASLSENDRYLLRCKYEGLMTIRVIAAKTGRSEGGVYKTMQRIHRTLGSQVTKKMDKEK